MKRYTPWHSREELDRESRDILRYDAEQIAKLIIFSLDSPELTPRFVEHATDFAAIDAPTKTSSPVSKLLARDISLIVAFARAWRTGLDPRLADKKCMEVLTLLANEFGGPFQEYLSARSRVIIAPDDHDRHR